MRKIFQFIFCLFILALPYSCGKSKLQEKTKEDQKETKDESLQLFLQSYESLFKTHFNATGCPGAAVVIVKDSSIIFMKSFGIKEVGKPDSVNTNTVFRIASLSKAFSAVLTGILVEKKLLNWNDKVISYLPDFELNDTGQTKRIEIQHLLSHTTGLPRHALGEYIEDGMALPDIMKKMKKVKLEGEEGKFFAYQNVAFSVIQEIVKSKTNKEFIDWMREEIFKKGNMKHASITYNEFINEPNKAIPHDGKNKEYVPVPIHANYYNVAAAGGINASISDMAAWLNILLGYRPDIVSKQTLDHVFTPFIEMNKEKDEDRVEYYDVWDGVQHSYYGMGWRIIQYNNRTLIHHGGFVNNYRSEIAIDRGNKIGICIL